VIEIKTLQGKIVVILLMIGLAFRKNGGVNWKLYAFNAEKIFFYDAVSLISPSDGPGREIVKVWIRKDFTRSYNL
jgi:hypothetical protein